MRSVIQYTLRLAYTAALMFTFWTLFGQQSTPPTVWLDAKRNGSVAYFLFASSPRLEAYDLDKEQWSPSITFEQIPSAFHVDDTFLYVAFGQAVYRYALDGTNKVLVDQFDNPVHGLFTDGNILFVNYSHGLWGYVDSVHRETLTPIDSAVCYVCGLTGSSIEPNTNALYGVRKQGSPDDIHVLPYTDQGAFLPITDSPYHGSYSIGERTFVWPDGSRVADASGNIYTGISLNYVGSMATQLDDLGFHSVDNPIGLYNNSLINFSKAGLQMGSIALVEDVHKIFVRDQDVATFYPTRGNSKGMGVSFVKLDAFRTDSPGQPLNPGAQAFLPDKVFIDKRGTLFLYSKIHASLYRWSIEDQRWLTSIPLLGAAEYVTYSPSLDTVYTGYGDGQVMALALDDDSTTPPREKPFANLSTAPIGLIAAGEFIVGADHSGAWGSYRSFAGDGTRIHSVEWKHPLHDAVWSAANRRIYHFRDFSSPNDLIWTEVRANGTIGAEKDSPYHSSNGIQYPIRVHPNGSIVVIGSGRIYNALSLDQIDTLPSNVDDVSWVAGRLFAVEGNKITHFQTPTYTRGSTLTVSGDATPLIIATPNNTLIVVDPSEDRPPSIDIYDPDLQLVAPPILKTPALALQSIGPGAAFITWSDGSGEKAYHVELQSDAGEWRSQAILGKDTTSYRQNGLMPGTTYRFRVRSENEGLFSDYSNRVEVTGPKSNKTPRRIEASFVLTPPRIDGVVSPGEWDSAVSQGYWSLLRKSETDQSNHNDRVRFLWDKEALYMLYQSDYAHWSPNPTAWPREQSLSSLNTGIRFDLDNFNLYLDPNTDHEAQFRDSKEVDGYQIAWNNFNGDAYLRNGRFLNTQFYLEAHVNGPFNNRGGWSPPALANSELAQSLSPKGGVIEFALHWSDLNAANPSTLEFSDIDESLHHPFAPKVDDTWILNAARITSDPANQLPIWSWHDSLFFALAPHGEIVFRGLHSNRLIAHYPLDETSGATIADQSGIGPDGSLHGVFQLQAPPLVAGTSIHFSQEGHARLPARRITFQGFSISLWFQPDTLDQPGVILAQGALNQTHPTFALSLSREGALNLRADGRLIGTTQNGLVSPQGPVHLVLTYQPNANNGTVNLYANGTRHLAAFGTDPWPLRRAPQLTIAGFPGQANVAGRFDEVQVYSQILSPTEIQSLTAGGTSPLPAPPSRAPLAVGLLADSLAPGPIAEWTNSGTLGGPFTAQGNPKVEVIAGHKAVALDGVGDYFRGPPSTSSLEGGGNPRSVEAWIYNPGLAPFDPIVSWGHLSGAKGEHFSLRAGSDAPAGAVSLIGPGDSGWKGQLQPEIWTYVVSTLDQRRQHRLYLQGELAASENLGNRELAAHQQLPILIGAEHHDASGNHIGNLSSIYIGSIRVHEGTLSKELIQSTFRQAAPAYGLTLVEASPDTLDDAWERLHFGDLSASPGSDPDGDGLNNEKEQEIGTHPHQSDTDQDGFLDGDELAKHSDPTDPSRIPVPNAWKIVDGSSHPESALKFEHTLSIPQTASVQSEGWHLLVDCRMIQNFDSPPTMAFGFSDGLTRSEVVLGFDTQGALTAKLPGGAEPTFRLATGPINPYAYHRHELRYDPSKSSQRLSYSFNGQAIHSWNGLASSDNAGVVCWGAGSGPGQGELNQHQVQFNDVRGNALAAYSAGYDPLSGPLNDPYHQGWTRKGGRVGIREHDVSPDDITDLARCRKALELGQRPGLLLEPDGITGDASGRILVTDSANGRVSVYSPTGQYLFELAHHGNLDGQFSQAVQVGVDSQGNRIVLDYAKERITVYSSTDQFLHSFGRPGSNPGQFSTPQGLSVPGDGRILVADTGNNRIQIFNTSGDFQLQFGSRGAGDGQFLFPSDIAVSPSGEIVVSDLQLGLIKVFDANGNFLRQFGVPGTEPGQLHGPVGLFVDSQSRILVADRLNHRIQIFDLLGAPLGTIGSYGINEGQLSFPQDIYVDGANNVWITNPGNGRVQQFNSQGQFIRELEQTSEQSDTLKQPNYAVFDSDENLLVTDSQRHEVKVFDRHGRFRYQFGSFGTNAGEFSSPLGITLDRQQRVLIADSGNSRIQVLDRSGTFISAFGTQGTAPGEFTLPSDVAVSRSGVIAVADPFNNRVQLFDAQHQFLRSQEHASNPTDTLNRPISVAFDRRTNLYVADLNNHRIVVYDPIGNWLRNIGIPGVNHREIGFPRDVLVDGQGRVLVSDNWNKRVQIFSNKGRFIRMIGEDLFRDTSGIALSPRGTLAICDRQWSNVTLWKNCLCFDHHGDVDCDGRIGILDIVATQGHRMRRHMSPNRSYLVDLDENGAINQSDIDLMLDQALREE